MTYDGGRKEVSIVTGLVRLLGSNGRSVQFGQTSITLSFSLNTGEFGPVLGIVPTDPSIIGSLKSIVASSMITCVRLRKSAVAALTTPYCMVAGGYCVVDSAIEEDCLLLAKSSSTMVDLSGSGEENCSGSKFSV